MMTIMLRMMMIMLSMMMVMMIIPVMLTMMMYSTEEMLRTRLKELNYSIIILCASPGSVREILLAADSLGLIEGDSPAAGQYVFFNVDLFTR